MGDLLVEVLGLRLEVAGLSIGGGVELEKLAGRAGKARPPPLWGAGAPRGGRI